ncbi:polymeric immunoglobulin receptor-like [Pygocentrus nattereri]|uniref:polymeric immunoglobulin receptor-like n=1 Tax=Pygocentrus nattereri TaxID=42514 RepID=UPI0018915915|nr:polymeric immunoglobulin receptor-like [Pygocentrus nattereri]
MKPCSSVERQMFVGGVQRSAGHSVDLNSSCSSHVLLRVNESGCPLAVSYRRITQTTAAGCALSENKQTVPVSRSSGESVLLSCTCTDQQDRPVGVQWRTPNQEDLLQRYISRVQTFDQSSAGNFSVLISDLTEEDGGTYSCWINQNQYRNFSLTVKDCKLSETQEKDIHKYPGEFVLLPCTCSDQHTKPVSVKWERVDSGRTEVSNEMELYKGRVQMFNRNLPANLSLLISNLTEQDQGTFRCSINNKQSINIRLSIRDCKLSETQEKDIHKYPGESVLLPCSCTDQRTTPVSVKWDHVDSGGTEVSNKMAKYTGRVQMFNKNLPANLSLLISNLTEQDQGTYRCSINNKQSINIRLNIRDCKLSETQEKNIHKYPGESVLLPCSCSDQRTTPVSVKWERVDSGGTEVSNEMELYKGRVQMFNKNLPANLSLLISNLNEQDQGTYRCSINNKQSINIRLSIKGCTLSETQEKLVFRSPGQSVLLPCSCTDQRTTPVSVKWEHVGSCGTEVSNETPRYTGRVQMFNKNLPANLSLLISNLTEQDQGTYRCSINNKQSINIRLSLTGEKREISCQSDSSGSLIPWIVCVALLFIVIGQSALIYKLLHNRTQGSASTNTERRTQNIADDDYENNPSGARNKISMAAIYQSLDPKTNQSDSVYQGLTPNTSQSDSVYQSLNPNTNQSDSVYQSLNPKINQSDSVYQSLNPNTIQSD